MRLDDFAMVEPIDAIGGQREGTVSLASSPVKSAFARLGQLRQDHRREPNPGSVTHQQARLHRQRRQGAPLMFESDGPAL